MNEINILMQLDHPNIIQLLEVFQNQQYIFIVMDYHSKGDLIQMLKKEGRFSEQYAKSIFS